MFYVYLLKSISNPSKTYVGYTTDLKERLDHHNTGGSSFTSEFRPWKLVAFVGFDEEAKAREFEQYLKVGSGHAFAKKYLW